jgi:hypothetical protein
MRTVHHHKIIINDYLISVEQLVNPELHIETVLNTLHYDEGVTERTFLMLLR